MPFRSNPPRLKPHKEPKRQKLRVWLHLFRQSPAYAVRRLFEAIAEDPGPFNRLLLRITLTGLIFAILGFLLSVLFSYLTVYVNGKPVLGPGS